MRRDLHRLLYDGVLRKPVTCRTPAPLSSEPLGEYAFLGAVATLVLAALGILLTGTGDE